MPWRLWLQQQIFLGQIHNEQRGPPALHREMPNRNHMQLHADPSADTLTATQRMLGYLQSNLPWATYLNTLPNMPLNYSDVHIEITQSLDQPPNATCSSLTSLGGYPPAPTPTATTAPTARDPIVTSHSLSRPGGYNSAPTTAKRRHTDPPNNCDNGTTQAQHHQPRSHQQPRPATFNATERDPIPRPNRQTRRRDIIDTIPILHSPKISRSHPLATASHASRTGTRPPPTPQPHPPVTTQERPSRHPYTRPTFQPHGGPTAPRCRPRQSR